MAVTKPADKTAKSTATTKEKKVIKKPDLSPEGKAANFKKIAGRRTKKIITTLQNLGNTSNKNVYNYTDEQVEYIFASIEKQLKLTREKFAAKQAEKKTDFELK